MQLLCEALDAQLGEVWYLGSGRGAVRPCVVGVLSRDHSDSNLSADHSDGALSDPAACRRRAIVESSGGPFPTMLPLVNASQQQVCCATGVQLPLPPPPRFLAFMHSRTY